MFFYVLRYGNNGNNLQIVNQTWPNLVTWTCGSWSVGLHDLHFTVQWFCLISWRLFYICTSYFGFMNQYDPRFDLKIIVGHCDLYFTVHWFLHYILKIIWFMNIILWDYGSVWPDVWPQNKCMSLWPIFNGQWFCLISQRLYDEWVSYFQILRQTLTSK